MKLEKIIDILGETKNCNYIVRRTQTPHGTFKGFSEYVIELYIVEDSPKLLFCTNTVVPPQKRESALERAEEDFIRRLFSDGV